MATKDPNRYFRIEARDLLTQLGEGMLALEQGADTHSVVARLLRLAHTLKGAASVVRQSAIAAHAHAIEDILAPLRDGAAEATREQIDALLRLTDQIGEGVAALEPPALAPSPAQAAAAAVSGAAAQPMAEIPQLAPEELDALLSSVDQTHAHLGGLRKALALTHAAAAAAAGLRVAQATQAGAQTSAPQLGALSEQLVGIERLIETTLHQLGRELLSVRDAAEQLRLLPASHLFMPLQRIARDAAQSQGKQLSFKARGGEVRMEAPVLNAVQGALVQMVRNAVAHGIEPRDLREAIGKPAQGQIALTVERRGRHVAFICSDDGAGVDLASVRLLAQSRGARGAELEKPALLQMLLRGGLTTSSRADSLSGRGVGMDVVRETAERLGGELSLTTESGLGSTLELRVPLQLAALRVLCVEAGGQQVYLPLDVVQQVLNRRELAGASVLLDGELLPHAPLARALQPEAENGSMPPCTLILNTAGGRAAIAVDALHGIAVIVLRPPPALLPASSLVAGVALDAAQWPRLVLDPDGLLAFARQAPPPAAPRAPALPLVLVVDDSLTTRMLEQSILEAAGYAVHTVASAEEGLEAARRQRYTLFLVDVEMPGMDGFDFIARTRADPELREVPAMLVSSRNAPEDKQRGREVGASGYIVKSEFAQREFLQQVHALVHRVPESIG